VPLTVTNPRFRTARSGYVRRVIVSRKERETRDGHARTDGTTAANGMIDANPRA